MRHSAVLRGSGLCGNHIFDRSSPDNRDNCFLPYIFMRELFLANGIELNTVDCNSERVTRFEIHQDVQEQRGEGPAYLLLLETPLVRPQNSNSSVFDTYHAIFTWDDSLVDGERFIKINYPNPLIIPEVDGFTYRTRLCCIIAGNKAMAIEDSRELYSERVRAIRWFERYAPLDFDLYGVGWNLPPARIGLIGKIEKHFWRYVSRFFAFKFFPSYRGKVEHKCEVLKKTRFSICYENARDMPGYITEKLFDCFFSGCVPVYWGASNVADHIPADCFIDRRNFSGTAEVYEFIKSMNETTYRDYQERIKTFLLSDAAKPFSANTFAETIVEKIVEDLGYGA